MHKVSKHRQNIKHLPIVGKAAMDIVASCEYIDRAYNHITKSTDKLHFSHDIWDLRCNWPKYKTQIKEKLINDQYQLSPAKSYNVNGESVLVWHPLDKVLLKALSLYLTEKLLPKLKSTNKCYHLKGKGLKSAVSDAYQLTKEYNFVFKTDIEQYYASIDRHCVQNILEKWIKDKRIMRLIWQYCDRVAIVGGDYLVQNQGLPKGGPLSIVLGTFYLNCIDEYYINLHNKHSKKQNNLNGKIKYLRYMDDIIIFCKNRFTLRKVIKDLYRLLALLKLKLAKLKTYIGKVTKDFDFLGYRLGGDSIINSMISASKTSIQRHYKRLQQLYEQRASNTRVADYVKRWMTWVRSGLGSILVNTPYEHKTVIQNRTGLVSIRNLR